MKTPKVGLLVGASVAGLLVVLSSNLVGMGVGAGDGGDVGFGVVGWRVGGGVAGRHGVNAMRRPREMF